MPCRTRDKAPVWQLPPHLFEAEHGPAAMSNCDSSVSSSACGRVLHSAEEARQPLCWGSISSPHPSKSRPQASWLQRVVPAAPSAWCYVPLDAKPGGAACRIAGIYGASPQRGSSRVQDLKWSPLGWRLACCTLRLPAEGSLQLDSQSLASKSSACSAIGSSSAEHLC